MISYEEVSTLSFVDVDAPPAESMDIDYGFGATTETKKATEEVELDYGFGSF